MRSAPLRNTGSPAVKEAPATRSRRARSCSESAASPPSGSVAPRPIAAAQPYPISTARKIITIIPIKQKLPSAYAIVRHGCSAEKIAFLARLAFEGRYSAAEIDRWLGHFLHRFRTQQFKRSSMPDGPKVGSVALSPRGDWRMPSDLAGGF